MTKIPFGYVAERVHRLRELSAIFASTVLASDLLDELDSYLTACGWTEFEFDSEELKRIDSNWETVAN